MKTLSAILNAGAIIIGILLFAGWISTNFDNPEIVYHEETKR